MRRITTTSSVIIGFALLATGCAGGAAEAPPASVRAQAADATPGAAETVAVSSMDVQTVPVFLSRDPFSPLLEAAPVSVGDFDDLGGDPAVDPAGQSGGCASTADGQVCDGVSVGLVNVGETDGVAFAEVRVDSQIHNVGVGDTFAVSFQVEALTARCATLLYGDDSFTLCEGDTILK